MFNTDIIEPIEVHISGNEYLIQVTNTNTLINMLSLKCLKLFNERYINVDVAASINLNWLSNLMALSNYTSSNRTIKKICSREVSIFSSRTGAAPFLAKASVKELPSWWPSS